ncbi:uncharacterized protein [Eucyclogobius newberryi]|uniref:uncharacterized protein n=1 Tax=Eucyclogobius newberryi TaxID=166745 RepID=UPI003B59097B
MACNNNLVLLSLGFFLLYSLCQCTSHTKKLKENRISLSKMLHWHHGKLLIGLKPEQDGKSKETIDLDFDYQSDMTWEVPGSHPPQEHGFPRHDNTAVERLLKMDPTVDCSGNYMRLKVQDADSKPGALLFVDRGELSPLSLSKLPKSCGYKISSTRRDLVIVAPYDGCFVLVEESRYVLPLRWLGLPVQMSCPLSQPLSHSSNPPMVTCHAEGMVVKTDWTSGLSEIKVNLNGNWEPLMKASPRCGFGAVEHPEGTTISISYKPCMETKDGFYGLKLLRDNEVKVLCPSLYSADSSKPMMDVGDDSTPPRVPEYPIPPAQSQTWNQFYPSHWYIQHPEAVQQVVPQPTSDKMVGQPFYPGYPELPLSGEKNPGNVPPGLDDSVGHSYSMFYPNVPPQHEPAHPAHPDDPARDSTQLFYPQWYMPEPHPAYPFYYPQDPVKPTAFTESTAPPEPQGPVPPVYLYPHYYPTEQPELTSTASPPATVPKHQFFGPYFYPLPSQHPPHEPTTPTPPTQKPHNPPISRPGTVVIFPPNAKPGTKPVVCSQYCQLGLPYCCPQVAFHHHMYHFVPHEQNGNSYPQFPPLQGLPNGFIPNFGYGPPGLGEAPVHPSRTAFSNALRGQHERQTYNRPLEGNPATQSENQPNEQTGNQPAYPYFEPHAYVPYSVMNHWNHQNHPDAPSSATPSHYSEYFAPVQGANVYSPYNVQSSQQSDGPPALNVLSRSHQHVLKPAKRVKGPASLDRPVPNLVPYHTLQEQDRVSNHHSADDRKTAKREETQSYFSEQRGYVLLQQGPPGRESSNPVLTSDTLGQKREVIFPKEFLKLKGESGNADLTPGGKPGPQLQTSSSTGPNAPPSSKDPSGKKLSERRCLY